MPTLVSCECEKMPVWSTTHANTYTSVIFTEFNPTTHQVSSDSKKVFATAKSCMYRRQDLFSNIIPIQRAKTPIIKILHVRTQTSCDLSFRDAIGYCNSRLLRHYLNMNERQVKFNGF